VTRLNDAPIVCEGCVTGMSHAYALLVPKHKSARDVYVLLHRAGGVVEQYNSD